MIGSCSTVILRLRAPVTSLVIAAVTSIVYPQLAGDYVLGWVFLQVCLMSFAMINSRTQAIYATASVGVLVLAQALIQVPVPIYDPLALALVAWTTAAGGVGAAISAHRSYVKALEDQNRRALEIREAIVARHIAEERLRIARELHDVMAHHVAAINVHAGSVEANLPADAGHLKDPLTRIRDASRSALLELQSILQLLRSDDGMEDTTAPTSGSEQIPELIDSFRRLGLHVEFTQNYSKDLSHRLSPTQDLALFRVVQEGLTNAHRHGQGSAHVVIHQTASTLTVKISNTPRQDQTEEADPARPHFGLVGMQERVSSAGGHLDISRTAEQFTILVVFPHLALLERPAS
ncbi:sensor histidine kinase [Arthrobacter sp. MDT2-16]